VTVSVTSVDRDVLPAALLPMAKFHIRLDPTGDAAVDTQQDDFIKSLIARAIGHLQDKLEVTINPTEVEWTPAAADFSGGQATVPVRPADGAALKWSSIHGVPIQIYAGAEEGVAVTLSAGYADLDALPPTLLDLVLRMTSVLYEHREIFGEGREPMTLPPMDQASAWWAPRC
jgi:hypothetical protein